MQRRGGDLDRRMEDGTSRGTLKLSFFFFIGWSRLTTHQHAWKFPPPSRKCPASKFVCHSNWCWTSKIGATTDK
ncbi:hypothetical protein Hanom_Chr04g00355101 [Helianthus anomalus]